MPSDSDFTPLLRRRASLFIALFALLALAAFAGYYVGQSRVAPMSANTPAQSGMPGQKTIDPYIAGPLKNTLRKNALALQQPWLDYLKLAAAKPDGRIELDWNLDAQGKPSRVSLIRSDFQNSQFETALMRAIEHMEFPPTGQEQRYVSHTFAFKKEAP